MAGPRAREPAGVLRPAPGPSSSRAVAGSGGGSRPPGPRRKAKRSSVGVDSFEYLKVVGKGAFGKVLVVRHKSTGKVYAMKVLEK